MAYKDKRKRNAYAREWNQKNRERTRATAKASYYKHHDKNKERGRWNAIRYTYGISREDYNQMAEEQDYSCAICGTRGKLFIDHDHDSNMVRGLLCPNCNTLLGHAKENPLILQSAMIYLHTYHPLKTSGSD